MSDLLADNECRVCYHVHPHAGRCGQLTHDPGPNDTDVTSICECREYVDLEAEGRIVVAAYGPRSHEVS